MQGLWFLCLPANCKINSRYIWCILLISISKALSWSIQGYVWPLQGEYVFERIFPKHWCMSKSGEALWKDLKRSCLLLLGWVSIHLSTLDVLESLCQLEYLQDLCQMPSIVCWYKQSLIYLSRYAILVLENSFCLPLVWPLRDISQILLQYKEIKWRN